MAMLDDRLAPFRLAPVLLGIARAAALLKTWQNDPSFGVDRQLSNRFLPTYWEGIERIHRQSSDRVTFTRLNLLYVAKQACRVCSVEGREVETEQDVEQVLSCCLLANDLLLEREPGPSDTTIAKAANLLPFGSYVPHNSYATDIARNLLLIEQVAPQLSARSDYIDLATTFAMVTGVSPRDFCQLAFSAAVKFITNVETQMNDPSTAFLLTPDYFQHSAVTSQNIVAFLERLSTTPAALHEQADRRSPGADFIAFQRRPLVEYTTGTYLCLDPGFLLDKAGPSLYWTLHEETGRRKDLLSFWSVVVERYAHWLFEQVYQGSGSFVIGPRYNNGDEACDLCLVEGSVLILFEVKASILTSQAKYGFSPDTLVRELESKAINGDHGRRKGVAQLSRALRRFLNGEDIPGVNRSAIRTIYPVLVFLDRGFTAPYLNVLYNERFDSWRLRKQYRRAITPLFSITIEDLENVLPHTQRHLLSDILHSYNSSNKNMFGELSHSTVPILQGQPPGRDPVRQRFEQFGADLGERFFPDATQSVAPPVPDA